MYKKVLSASLSFLILCFAFVPAFAASGGTISVSSAAAEAGTEVIIKVEVSDNPGINTFALGFEYDTSRLELKNVTPSANLGGQFAYSKRAVWLGSSDTKYNGVILILTFRVLDAAADGDAGIAVTYGEGDISNYDEEDVDFELIDGKITVGAHVHKWDPGKVTKAATVMEDGEMTYTCSVCGETKIDMIPKLEPQPADRDYSPGDVDGNGQILANDARLALRASAKLERLDDKQQKAADVDGDGNILADDARQILRFSAKLQSEFSKK